MGPSIVASIEAEFQRYKALAEGAMNQLRDDEYQRKTSPADNSIATLVWHISGNLTSRFTDFLTSDGEKEWRDRESEFRSREVSRAELQAKWELGWQVLFDSLRALTDAELDRVVTIRGAELRVHEALHRSLAHASYHVGQIVYASKMLRRYAWTYLSIPPGRSAEYNRNPASEKPGDQAARIRDRVDASPSPSDTAGRPAGP